MDELIFALLFIVLVASAIYKYCELQHQINLCMIFIFLCAQFIYHK